MTQRIQRSSAEPERVDASWDERWRGPDHGLIACWEAGRELAKRAPEIAERARNGELPLLAWKGGVEGPVKKRKHGTLNYLPQWQALRGEDLNIDLDEEYEVTCSRTGVTVTFTSDRTKWGVP